MYDPNSPTPHKTGPEIASQQCNEGASNDQCDPLEIPPASEDSIAVGFEESGELNAPVHERSTRSQSSCDPMDDSRIFMRRKSRTNRSELPRIGKTRSNDTAHSLDAQFQNARKERRPSKATIESEVDSHASRSSQETEKDVCFPMLREHVRVNGIDFDEMEDFIRDERALKTYTSEQYPDHPVWEGVKKSQQVGDGAKERRLSSSMEKAKGVLQKASHLFEKKESISPKAPSSAQGFDFVRMGSDSSGGDTDKKIDESVLENVKFKEASADGSFMALPNRFSFFHSDNEETIHAPDLPSLVKSDESVSKLFKDGKGTWWLDCTCPTDGEMRTLAKAFGIHPLTAEDIRMQEVREKVELFKDYYFLCFHTFEPDRESENFLEPIHIYIVVFREGILTFHFSPVAHPANVRRRIRQLRDYVDVTADWIGYAIIDDITDGFAPVITGIEYEADAIEDSVFDALTVNFSSMLRKIGESRKKVMTLMRLLSNKADVIRMFAKRCQDEAWAVPPYSGTSRVNLAAMPGQATTHSNTTPTGSGTNFGPQPGASPSMMSQMPASSGRVQPRADIALYLGDIQDHVVTMFQNLAAYEKIFSRSHSNYLAQLQVESFNANLTVTRILGNVTMIGTVFLPLNVFTSLFGMNVKVPGEGEDIWFWGICAFMVVFSLVSWGCVKYFLHSFVARERRRESTKREIGSLSVHQKKQTAKSILTFPNRYD